METWAQRLRDWMAETGINVPELSRRSGVGEASLYKHLKGRTAAPRGEVLSDIAKVFGKTDSELQYGVSQQTRHGTFNIPLLSGPEMTAIPSADVWRGRVVQVSGSDLTSDAFAVEVLDGACSPKIDPGDIVIIDPSRDPEPGSYCAAFVESLNAGVVRKYRPKHATDKSEFHLVSTNDDYPTITVQSGGGRLLGRAVKVIKAI